MSASLSSLKAPAVGPVKSENVRCVGHRGFPSLYPENTMPSFMAALDAGADGLELDIRLTKDNEIIVMHDATLDRTTNGTGNVTSWLWSDVQQLRAHRTNLGYSTCFPTSPADPAVHPSAGPADAPIPKLTEVLDVLVSYSRPNVTAIIDIKWDNPLIIMTHLRKVLELPQYAALLPQLTLGIWSPHFIWSLPPRSLPVKRSFIGESLALAQLFCRSVDNFSIDVNLLLANPDWVHQKQAAGYTISAWTVDSAADVNAVFDIGVNNIISDCVSQCVAIRSNLTCVYDEGISVSNSPVKRTPSSSSMVKGSNGSAPSSYTSDVCHLSMAAGTDACEATSILNAEQPPLLAAQTSV